MSDKSESIKTFFSDFLNELNKTAVFGGTLERWTLNQKFEHTACYTELGTGMAIYATYDSYSGKISFGPSVPLDNGGYQSLSSWIGVRDSECQAAISAGRKASVVIKDIRRRVIEPYEKHFPKLVEEMKRRNDRRELLAQRSIEIFELLNASENKNTSCADARFGYSYSSSGVSAEIDISHSNAEIKLKHMHPTEALIFARHIRAAMHEVKALKTREQEIA